MSDGPTPAIDADGLAARFTRLTLPKAEWTHAAHLAVGAWHVDRYGPAEALRRLRGGIQRLNESHGRTNTETAGYHETITAAYVSLLAEFLDACPAGTSLNERVARLLASPLADRDALLKVYSRDLLMSSAARAARVDPDLAPLRLETIIGSAPVA